MTKHTPGPWKVYDDGCIYTVDGVQVLTSYADSDGHCIVATDADRRLAAAAPELLAALEVLLDAKERGDHKDKAFRAARAAIAKARGGM